MDKTRKHRFFSNNIFARTLTIFSLMSGVTLIAMFLLLNQLILDNQREQLSHMNIAQLQRVEEDIDTRIEGIQRSMSQFFYSTNSVSMMVKADMSDAGLSSGIMNSLAGLVNENDLIREAVFYLPTTQTVFSAGGFGETNFVDLDNYMDKDRIYEYLKSRTKDRPNGEDIHFQYLMKNGGVFLTADFCVPNFLGALVLELEHDQFNSILQGKSETSQGRYFAFNREDGEIIASDMWIDTVRKTMLEGACYDVDQHIGNRACQVYVTGSHWDNIGYGVYRDAPVNLVSFRTLCLTFLPFLGIYILFALLYSAYVTRSVYRPISRLMRITVNRRAELDEIRKDESRNELQYLEEAFRDTWVENRQNRQLLANISQDMLEQIFRTVINGRQVDEKYIATTLQGLGLEQLNSGRYVALAGYLMVPDDRELTPMETGMYRRSLSSFVAEYTSKEGKFISFFLDQNLLVITACYAEDQSATVIKKSIQELEAAMEQYVEGLPFSILMGVGKTYNDIVSLRNSYQEAYEQIEYQRYVADGGADMERTESADRSDRDNQYFRERAELIAETAEKDRRDTAEQLAATIISEILSAPADKRHDCYEVMADVLIEKMIAVHVSQEEIKQLNLSMEKAFNYENRDLREEKLTSAVFDVVKTIHVSSRKSRYRYVDVAKDYIASHYADGNLTLNEVADAVGISAPYLSGIFAESEDIGFASYLSNYRIEQAKQFLEQTMLSVTDVGYKCGFNSAQSFSRVFKKNTGYTPGFYREYCRERSAGGSNI